MVATNRSSLSGLKIKTGNQEFILKHGDSFSINSDKQKYIYETFNQNSINNSIDVSSIDLITIYGSDSVSSSNTFGSNFSGILILGASFILLRGLSGSGGGGGGGGTMYVDIPIFPILLAGGAVLVGASLVGAAFVTAASQAPKDSSTKIDNPTQLNSIDCTDDSPCTEIQVNNADCNEGNPCTEWVIVNNF